MTRRSEKYITPPARLGGLVLKKTIQWLNKRIGFQIFEFQIFERFIFIRNKQLALSDPGSKKNWRNM